MSEMEQTAPGKPGIAVKGFPPNKVDDEFLELYFGKFGEVERIEISEKQAVAYVEFQDPTVISHVLSKSHTIRKCPITVEEIDLLQVWQPYLIVKGFPSFVNDQMLSQHFKGEAGGAEVESVEIVEGSEARIFYMDPIVVLEVATKKQALFGAQLTVEVAYSSPKPQEECALTVKGLPPMDTTALKPALEYYFKQEDQEVVFCEIVDQVAYLKFSDSTAVRKIVSQPPEQEFLSGVKLQMSLTPVSQLPGGDPPSTYSSDMQQEKLKERQEEEMSSPLTTNTSDYTASPEAPPLQGKLGAVNPPRPNFPSYLITGDSPPVQQPPNETVVPNQIIIEGFPQGTQEFVLQLYLGNLSQPLQCTGVKMYGTVAVATFAMAVDFNSLVQKSRMMPFPQGNQVIIISPMKLPDTVVVSGIPENTQEFVIQLYFQQSAPVKKVKLVPPNKALVTFENHENVQQVLKQQHTLGSTPIIVEEYHPFLDPQPTSQPISQPNSQTGQPDDFSFKPTPQPDIASPPKVKHIWGPQKQRINTEKQHYLQHTLDRLNEKLETSKAKASIERDGSDTFVIIKPQSGSGELADWEETIGSTLQDHFATFMEEKHTFTMEAKAEVLEYITNQRNDHPELYVKPSGNTFTIAGTHDVVREILEKVTHMCQAAQVISTSHQLTKRQVKFLLKFCKEDLNATAAAAPQASYSTDAANGIIKVKGNQSVQQKFQEVIDRKVKSIHQTSLRLSQDAYNLFSSKQGTAKINGVLGDCITKLVYDFDDATMEGGGAIWILSTDAAICTRAVHTLEQCIQTKALSLPPRKLEACKLQEWKQFEANMKKEFFIHISIKTNSIVVMGEASVLQGAEARISHFLHEQTSVEDHVVYQLSEWKVIRENLTQALNKIKDQAKQKNVRVMLPNPTNHVNPTKVPLRGEPDAVVAIKGELEKLKQKVFKKETKIAGLPGLVQVLQSMEDRFHVLEQTHKAAIEVNIESADSATGGRSKSKEATTKIFTATAPDGSKLTVVKGNFTQYHYVGSIVNFLQPGQDPEYSQGNLKILIDAGGIEVQEDLQSKIGEFMMLSTLHVFNSNRGNLKCSQLLHCVIPNWSQGTSSEPYFLEEALKKTFEEATQHGSLLITPATAQPFNYPANIFAEKVTGAFTSSPTFDDIQVVVFVEIEAHAKEFEECLKAHNFQVNVAPQIGASPMRPQQISKSESASSPRVSTTPTTVDQAPTPPVSVPTSVSTATPVVGPAPAVPASASMATTTSSQCIGGVTSFITLTNGDMFQQQGDVYINSTNPSLDLSQGIISKMLLKACGPQLQEECKEYAPLAPGAVAVTSAANLKCKYIFHVSLPGYSSSGSENVFRETVQNILQSAQTQRASSIVIPSLGVAGLGYPASVSAKILFEEVIAFHIRNPTAVNQFHFVIFQKDVFQEFDQVFTQWKSQPLPTAKDLPPAPVISATPTSVHHVTSPAKSETTPSHSHNGKVQSDGSQLGTRLYIVHGDISDETSDIIVNTTTENMDLQATAVSRALSHKAGSKLQSACRQLFDNGVSLEEGRIAVTNSFGQLRCKKIIHAYLPDRRGATKARIDPQLLVEKIVTACIEKAEQESMESISFPAFGMGLAGYSVTEAAEPMLKALQRFGRGKPKSVKTIRIVILDQSQYQELHSCFCKFFNRNPQATHGSQGFLRYIGSKVGLCQSTKDDTYVELQAVADSVEAVAGSLSARGPRITMSAPPQLIPNPIAVFKIYAASLQSAQQIERDIRAGVKQRVTTKTVQDPQITFLLHDDAMAIESIGDQLGVVIKVLRKINQIQISGEWGNVSQAQMKITSTLREIEKAQSELQIYEWQSQDGETYEPYLTDASIRLERAFKQRESTVEMSIDDVAVTVDLNKMEELNKSTGDRRSVRRVKKAQIEYPKTWQKQPKEGGKPVPCHKFDVPTGSAEYKDAIREFEATIRNANCTIIKVQRIQNPSEYAKHASFQQILQQKYGKKVEERRLFHGTRMDSIEAISYQGFNRIFAADANAAAYGRGAYFAVNAEYSARQQYAKPDSSGQQYMFVCNVVIGKYTKGSSSMKVAPSLPDNPHVLYDSLVDNEQNPSIFVAMTDSQAYPEYLITFKL